MCRVAELCLDPAQLADSGFFDFGHLHGYQMSRTSMTVPRTVLMYERMSKPG